MSLLKSLLLGFLFPLTASAQMNPSVRPDAVSARSTISFVAPLSLRVSVKRKSIKQILNETDNGLPNIVLIGYWTPTNEMVREFSPHIEQNPDGWKGSNWEGRGYNIYSFFPEFADGDSGQILNAGLGDFQVDYQNTSHDFWSIVPKFDPVAVLSFGRALPDNAWQIELNTRNLSSWIADDQAPFYPTPAPPDASLRADTSRLSRFPSEAIIQALKSEESTLRPLTNRSGAGSYLCEYLGYHLSWYRELNPGRVQFAAHTHIGSASDLPRLKSALKISLRALIASLEPCGECESFVRQERK